MTPSRSLAKEVHRHNRRRRLGVITDVVLVLVIAAVDTTMDVFVLAALWDGARLNAKQVVPTNCNLKQKE